MLLDDAIARIPVAKRRPLKRALQILFEEFEEAQKGKLSETAKRGRILKVILFGSYARGTHREDPGTGFISDFDLLVVVNDDHFAGCYEAWDFARDRYIQETIARSTPCPEASIVVHSYADLNDQLGRGRPFFSDIVREGITLYEAEGYPLAATGPFSDEMRHEEAWVHYDQWFSGGAAFKTSALVLIEQGQLRRAAFLLHQSAESLYHCALLVLTLYSPKSHALRKLRKLAEGVAPRLAEAWPRTGQFARRVFHLLHDAYVKGRYSRHYALTREELAWMVARVEVLNRLVDEVCRERLGERPPGMGGQASD